MQPLVEIDGVVRFKANAIVRHLLNYATDRGCGLNEIAAMEFTDADRCQLAQLIGYSLSGYSELSRYVSDEEYQTALRVAEAEGDPRDARIAVLEEKLATVKLELAQPMADLFGVHVDDLLHPRGRE